MSKKKILSIVLSATLLVVIILHFGFHDDIWNMKTDLTKAEKIELNDKNVKCYSKEVENKKRLIIIYKIKNNTDSKGISGVDIFQDNGNASYTFSGFEDNGIIIAFGQNNNNILEERIYKKTENGIIEGFVEDSNKEKILDKDKEIIRIIDKNDVIFDDKNIIQISKCETLG